MTNKDIIQIAMRQSAWDINCNPSDFLQSTHIIVDASIGNRARAYYQEPVGCNLVSYGNNIVASVKPAYREIVSEYIQKFHIYHCFEVPNMHWLDEKIQPFGQKICFMASFYLPDVRLLKRLSCDCELRVLENFEGLYTPIWSNALCEKRKELDRLGVGAYCNDQLIGLAGCSADCEDMWQIGVDVLPQYRKKGVAAALVSNLAVEILDRGKVPFYCSAWSNICSIKTAIRA